MSAVVFRAASAAVIVLVSFGLWSLTAIARDGAAHRLNGFPFPLHGTSG